MNPSWRDTSPAEALRELDVRRYDAPPKISITRRLEFDAGHRLIKHESKCSNAHGHRYVAEIECESESSGLDSVGRVIDFGVIKVLVGGWIDDEWDHAFLVEGGDPLGDYLTSNGQRVYAFPSGSPPTAENIAARLLTEARRLLAPCAIVVASVRLWETPNCWALAR